MYKRVFVTVGTTQFDELIAEIQKETVLKALCNLGCDRVTIQHGASEKALPDWIRDPESYGLEAGTRSRRSRIHTDNGRSHDIILDYYDYKPSIADDIAAADIVIGHAGAGTTIEVLRARTPFITVINTQLMDNHQWELADQLAADGYLLSCTSPDLAAVLQKVAISGLSLARFPDARPHVFAHFLDQVLSPSASTASTST